MKITFLILLFALSNCSLFDNSDSKNYGVCNEELFNRVEEIGRISIYVVYEMEWAEEIMLTDEEIEAQRLAIQNMHEKFLEELEVNGFLEGGGSGHIYRPIMALGAEREKLVFICNSELIRDVYENNTSN